MHTKVRGGLLAAMRQPEGEDEHGFDPAVIFKRYLWDVDPAEELTEERPPTVRDPCWLPTCALIHANTWM